MTDDLPAPVAALLAAANAHDTDAFVRTFEPDGEIGDWGRTHGGADAIRRWSDAEFIGVDVTLDVTGVAERGGETVVAAQVGGRGFNGPSRFAFTLEGDRVRRMTIQA